MDGGREGTGGSNEERGEKEKLMQGPQNILNVHVGDRDEDPKIIEILICSCWNLTAADDTMISEVEGIRELECKRSCDDRLTIRH